VSSRERTFAFGTTAALVAAGALCAVFVDGSTGYVLGVVIMLLGLVEALLLAFVEVGMTADGARRRAADEARRRSQDPPVEYDEYEDEWQGEIDARRAEERIGARPPG
jgi:hypothetical protein